MICKKVYTQKYGIFQHADYQYLKNMNIKLFITTQINFQHVNKKSLVLVGL